MTKEEKTKMIDELAGELKANPHFYIADVSALTAEKTSKLRRMAFNKKVKMLVVKNTLLEKAMEKSTGKDFKDIIATLKGSTSILFSEVGNAPAKLIKEFRTAGNDKPLLKAAYVEEGVYIGHNQLDSLANLKSKNELIGDIIGLLQSPAKNVIGSLQSSKQKLAGIVKTLSEKPE